MKPVNTTLTLRILVFPILVIFTLFAVVIYLYRTSLNASVVLETIPTLLSPVLVNLLVWERLRDSLSKKLEYLHKNHLFKLYQAFRKDIIYFWQDEVKRIRTDLERYGKFMSISLYPRSLLSQIDEFLASQTEFNSSLQKLNELVEQYGLSPKKGPSHKQLFYHFIGINPQQSLSSYAATLVAAYKKKVPLVLKEQSQLIEEIKGLLKKTERMRKQIFDKLEDFLKSNNLRLEAKPAYREYDL